MYTYIDKASASVFNVQRYIRIEENVYVKLILGKSCKIHPVKFPLPVSTISDWPASKSIKDILEWLNSNTVTCIWNENFKLQDKRLSLVRWLSSVPRQPSLTQLVYCSAGVQFLGFWSYFSYRSYSNFERKILF